jgi:SAM-dependent methyltransferase
MPAGKRLPVRETFWADSPSVDSGWANGKCMVGAKMLPMARVADDRICTANEVRQKVAAVHAISPSLSTYALQDQERMSLAQNYFAWQARLVTKELGQRILEVGCGIGNFTRFLLDREQVVALDLEPEHVDCLEERYREHRNLHAVCEDFTAASLSKLRSFNLDSCVCLNVLEHIEDDLIALRNMASLLLFQGVIVLLVPAFPVLFGPIDKNLCHYRRYRRRSMRHLAQAAGLRIKKMHYLNFAGFFGWWMNSHVFKREAQSHSQIKIFDTYIVPWLSRIEAFVPPPFGQSLLVVLQKP